MTLSQEQKNFLINLLSSVQVKASDPESIVSVQMIQSILEELKK